MAYLLHQLLAESAAKYPDKKAVIFENQSISYGELDKESSGLANVLLEMGIKKGDRVGIHLNRGINAIIAVFGILKTGAAYVPIDPLSPSNRLTYIIGKCRIRHLVTSQDKLGALQSAFAGKVSLEKILILGPYEVNANIQIQDKLVIWQENRAKSKMAYPKVDVSGFDLSYILFTSGSTGNPKGVMISHLNSLTFVNMAFDFFQAKENDVFSNNSPLHFDLSVFDLFVAFKAGATVAIVPETTTIFPVKLAEFIANNKITIWNSVPSALALLANYAALDKYDYSALRLILFAGEVFPIKYLRKLKQSIPQARFYNIYGQTEANSSMYYLVDHVPDENSALLPIGQPFPDFEVFALDEKGEKISKAGEKGELYVRSASVAFGYWDEPEKTSLNFVKNPLLPHLPENIYKTGDIVRLDEQGNYVFIGRKDHMIKSRGYRIEAGEIETVLANYPSVKIAIVVPIPDDLIGNRIAAIIVPLENSEIKREAIIQYCSNKLPKYMIPEVIEIRNSLPTTSSGKIDRKKLAEYMSEQQGS
jgi:amino acid adenylation domain-containing protein